MRGLPNGPHHQSRATAEAVGRVEVQAGLLLLLLVPEAHTEATMPGPDLPCRPPGLRPPLPLLLCPEPALVFCDPHWICGLGCTTHKMLICLELALAWRKPLVLCRPQYPLDGGWPRWFALPRCVPPYAPTTHRLQPPMCL
eukprot:EG_transcript_35183